MDIIFKTIWLTTQNIVFLRLNFDFCVKRPRRYLNSSSVGGWSPPTVPALGGRSKAIGVPSLLYYRQDTGKKSTPVTLYW